MIQLLEFTKKYKNMNLLCFNLFLPMFTNKNIDFKDNICIIDNLKTKARLEINLKQLQYDTKNDYVYYFYNSLVDEHYIYKTSVVRYNRRKIHTFTIYSIPNVKLIASFVIPKASRTVNSSFQYVNLERAFDLRLQIPVANELIRIQLQTKHITTNIHNYYLRWINDIPMLYLTTRSGKKFLYNLFDKNAITVKHDVMFYNQFLVKRLSIKGFAFINMFTDDLLLQHIIAYPSKKITASLI